MSGDPPGSGSEDDVEPYLWRLRQDDDLLDMTHDILFLPHEDETDEFWKENGKDMTIIWWE